MSNHLFSEGFQFLIREHIEVKFESAKLKQIRQKDDRMLVIIKINIINYFNIFKNHVTLPCQVTTLTVVTH